MKVVVSVILAATCAVPLSFVTAAPAPDEVLVQSAIAAEVRSTDQLTIRNTLERSGGRLTEALKIGPNEQVGGVIVFATGLDSKQVAAFASSYGLEVMRAEAKVALKSSNVTETMSFGAQSLFFLDGPLDERLEKLVGRQRGMFMAGAAEAAGSSRAEGLREAAYSRDIRFYKIEVVGPASSFDRIKKGTEAAAVFVDDSKARVDDVAVQKANAVLMRPQGGLVIKGRPFADGPPPGVVVGRTAVFGGSAVAPPDPVTQQPKQSNR